MTCKPVSPGTSLGLKNCTSSEINTTSCDNPTIITESCESPPPCPENHCLEIITNIYSTGIQVSNSWIIPSCNDYAILIVPNLLAVHLGSYIWNNSFGFYEIVAYNSLNGELTIKNNCNVSNAAPGTEVPTCTIFIITDIPCDQLEDLFPFLASDFTAPNVGFCTAIKVTTTISLFVGAIITLSTGVYLINSIVDTTTIEICNTGSGIIGGTTVYAVGLNGQLQYSLIVINLSASAQNKAVSVTGTINTVTTTLINTIGIALINPSVNRNMQAMYAIIASCTGNVLGANTNRVSAGFALEESINGAPNVVVGNDTKSFFVDSNLARPASHMLIWQGVLTIPASTTFTINGLVTVQYTGAVGGSYVIGSPGLNISVVGLGII